MVIGPSMNSCHMPLITKTIALLTMVVSKKILYFGTIFMVAVSCSSFRALQYKEGGREAMIYNSIIDFSNTENKLLKQDRCFFVFFDENNPQTIYVGGDKNKASLIIESKEPSLDKAKWIDSLTLRVDNALYGDEIITIDMKHSEVHPKISFNKEAVSISYRGFPNRILEIDGKLFFWHDKLGGDPSEKVIQTLYEYDYVDTLVQNLFFPDNVIDEGKICVSYTYNREDLSHYVKKTIRPHFPLLFRLRLYVRQLYRKLT